MTCKPEIEMKEVISKDYIIRGCDECPYVEISGLEDPYYYVPPTCNAPGVKEFRVKEYYDTETRHPDCPMVNKVVKERYEWE